LPFGDAPSSAASRGSSQQAPASPEAIQSLEAADLALAELADLDATEKQLDAGCVQACTLEREKFSARCVVVRNGRQFKIADRRAEIIEALQAFAEKHRDNEEVFARGEKSTKLNHGEFGFRLGNAKLDPIEGGAPKTYGQALDAIVAKLKASLNRLKLLFAAGDGKYLKVQVVLDRQALLAAAKEKEITAAELKKVGLMFVPGADAFFARPKAKEVTSQSANAPA
jgi:hypothetical protein